MCSLALFHRISEILRDQLSRDLIQCPCYPYPSLRQLFLNDRKRKRAISRINLSIGILVPELIAVLVPGKQYAFFAICRVSVAHSSEYINKKAKMRICVYFLAALKIIKSPTAIRIAGQK
jgi:hypothetical protein